MLRLLREFAKFGTVGAFALAVDMVGSYALAFGIGWPQLAAKTGATVLSTLTAFLGNRYWTYRDRPRTGYAREYALFFTFNAVALAVSLACLQVTGQMFGSHDKVGFTVGYVAGLVLGTLIRFSCYRRWVFLEAAETA